MNPELPLPPREELELRLTALLLGELSAEEAAALRQAIEQDGELARLFARLSRTIPLVREAVTSPGKSTSLPTPPLQLSEERREKLLAQFKTAAPKEFAPERRRDRFTLVELAAVLVILGSLVAISLPMLSPSRGLFQSQVDVSEARHASNTVRERSRQDLLFLQSPAPDGGSTISYSLDAVGYVDADATKQQPATDTNMPSIERRAAAETPATVFYSLKQKAALGEPVPAPREGEKVVAANGSVTVHLPPTALTSVVASSPKIALPPPESSFSAVAMDRQEVALVENVSLGTIRGLNVTAPSPISGVPVATPEFGVAQNASQDSERDFRHNNDPNPIPPPPPAGMAGAEPPAQFSGAEGVDAVALGKELKDNVGPAYRSRFGNAQAETATPRLSVSASMQDRGGEANGLGAITATNSAGAANQGVAGDYAPQGRDSKLAESKSTWADYDNDGSLARFAASSARTWTSDEVVPVLGDSPVVGQLFPNSGSDSFAAGSLAMEGRRIVPEPNAYGVAVAGLTDVENEPAYTAGKALNEAAGRQSTTTVLQALTTSVEPPQSQVATPEGKPAGDSRLTGGLRNQEALLAKAEAADRPLLEAPADLQENRAYFAKKRELQDLTESRQLLTRSVNAADIDQSLPKSSQVVIVDHATPKSAPNQSVWGAFRSAVSGDVERVARIKLERDKSDIAENSVKGSANLYDPYFVQTEFEVIQSADILGKVVSQLELDKSWARNKGTGEKLKTSEAVSLLRKRLDLSAVPNTALVEIRAKADQPEEAAQIANAVAEVYAQWRLNQGRALISGGLASLAQRSTEQDEKIKRVQKELEALGQAAGVAADLPVRKPATNAPIPQPEVQTSENNFSTFSLNVSDVSFKLAAASLEQGQMPDVATVRSEEFINAFDYRDPEPAPGAPIAFAWERARYPFAHNRELLRFSLKTAAAGRQAGRPLNVVLLLDNSGSMERADRVQIIREALRVLASQLQPQDKLSVITFARTARLVADGISGDKAGEVTGQVSGLTPEGGTNLEAAMNLAYQTAARHYLANGINRVVLLTDGAANLGEVEPDSLKQKVEAQRQQGIALDCFGIGWEGFNDDLLEVLSRNGDGRYGFINSPEEAATEFAGQLAGALKVAASDVKVQVEFNPRRVTSYRQIGYAKHQLTKEQFRDNTVDAAEIAAQEAGNALYTVEVNPAGEGPLGTVRVRYKIPGTTDYREQAWDVPFTGNVVSLEAASPALRLAATASAFSEWLVASPFAGEVSPHALLGYLRGVPEIYGADTRPKKLEWMIHQAKSIEGK